MAIPEIRYARSGGVAIAYQVVGTADTDLVYVPDFMSNLVYAWEYPRWRDFYLQLTERFRLILFDKRGTGLSDHGGQFATLETRMEDLHAVLDAVGSTSTVILASHEGCGMAALYAATYPERTRRWRCSTPGHTATESKNPMSPSHSPMSATAGAPTPWQTRSCTKAVPA
jgi:pimeloyl-ACP methyl ester carboxylesterase